MSSSTGTSFVVPEKEIVTRRPFIEQVCSTSAAGTGGQRGRRQ